MPGAREPLGHRGGRLRLGLEGALVVEAGRQAVGGVRSSTSLGRTTPGPPRRVRWHRHRRDGRRPGSSRAARRFRCKARHSRCRMPCGVASPTGRGGALGLCLRFLDAALVTSVRVGVGEARRSMASVMPRYAAVVPMPNPAAGWAPVGRACARSPTPAMVTRTRRAPGGVPAGERRGSGGWSWTGRVRTSGRAHEAAGGDKFLGRKPSNGGFTSLPVQRLHHSGKLENAHGDIRFDTPRDVRHLNMRAHQFL